MIPCLTGDVEVIEEEEVADDHLGADDEDVEEIDASKEDEEDEDCVEERESSKNDKTEAV